MDKVEVWRGTERCGEVNQEEFISQVLYRTT
jgi:hypothetical protein